MPSRSIRRSWRSTTRPDCVHSSEGGNMHRQPRPEWRDERGMTLAFVAIGLSAFLTATTLVVDVGMFMTARTQAQNAADSGALAGAVALVANSYTDRSATGPAVLSAINAAQANRVIGAAPSVQP